MGTSSNQSSPNTPPWRLPKAILGASGWPADRQSSEIWQAALADRQGKLRADFGDSLLAEACQIAERGVEPTRAVQAYDAALADNNAAGLALDMGRRALSRATAAQAGAIGFASELFAEAASYYVSRDLPSFLGAHGRVKTTTEAIHLKEQIKGIARDVARAAGPVRTDPDGWQAYISTVLSGLQGTGRRP